jgi:Flp pilus assembly protein TadG
MSKAMGETLVTILRRFGRARRGAAAIEMAFLAPVLVFLAAGIIDFGTGVYTKMMVADAAQAGAAYAQLNANSFTAASCQSNTNLAVCPWDTNVQSAATMAHGTATLFSSAVTATATVMSCCLNASGAIDFPNCTQPPAAAPTCTPATPGAGTYTRVATSATLTTLLPYSYAAQAFNFQIASPITMQANYFVRVQ